MTAEAAARVGVEVRMPNALRVLVAVVVGAATVAVVESLRQAVGRLPDHAWPLLVLLTLAVAAHLLPLRVRFATHQVLHLWDEITLVLGLGLIPLPWLVMVTWLGGLAALAASRNGVVKSLYNASSATLGTLVAGAVFYSLDGRYGAAAPQVIPLVAASIVFSLFDDVVVSAAVAGSRRLRLVAVLRDGFFVHHVMCLTNGAVALGFLFVAQAQPAALLSVPLILVALHWVQATGLRVSKERDAWQQLDKATRALNQLNRRSVVETAIISGCELFRSDAVEVLLEQDGAQRLVSGTISGVSPYASDNVRPRRVVTRPLEASDVRIGELRLCFAGAVRLSERESWALSTFSHGLTAALLNAQLYEEMQEHAALKAHEAEHDPLTGLANRTVLTERGEQMVADATKAHRVAALLLVDLDHFKQVNDTLGHEAGDQLLREVAHRLTGGVRTSDVVVRLGGDEFALLLPDLATVEDAATIAGNVLVALAEPMSIDGLELPIEASIGVACAPADAGTVRDLLRCADMAMYQAKGAPLSVRRYRRQDELVNVDRLTMVSELHAALDQDQLVLHFQPKIDLNSGRAVGAEALARWRRPNHGLVSASDFVPVLEQSSMVHGFALHVLDQALSAAATWGAGPQAPTVAVNLSARNLLDRNLPGDVATALDRHHFPPARLILEITETVMMSELDVVDDVLGALRQLGVQLSVDDFGTGFSSLTFLSRVHVDEVKIDRSFVSAMLVSPGDAAIVRAVLELGRNFGLRVVAEGVEVRDQQEHLSELGCESAQGFYLAPPMAAADVAQLFAPEPVPAATRTRRDGRIPSTLAR